MRIFIYISDMIIPTTFALIIVYGILNHVKLFDTFIEGTKDGFTTVLNIAPTIIGLMVAVGIIRASGTLDLLGKLITPLTDVLGFPKDAVPITLMRLVSSSASTGILLDLFKEHGPDSFIGRFVSIMMSCTETVFYTLSVYFMSVKITKTRYTIPTALLVNLVGVIVSLYITGWVYG